jgi:hypothetical protein
MTKHNLSPEQVDFAARQIIAMLADARDELDALVLDDEDEREKWYARAARSLHIAKRYAEQLASTCAPEGATLAEGE